MSLPSKALRLARRRPWFLVGSVVLVALTIALATTAAPPSAENTPSNDSGAVAADAADVYSCPMHPEVESSTAGRCPTCGMPLALRTSSSSSSSPGADGISYVCPMHPEVQSERPGRCSKCGMPLEKVVAEHQGAHTHPVATSTPPPPPTAAGEIAPRPQPSSSMTATSTVPAPMNMDAASRGGEAHATPTEDASSPDDEIAWYTCSMHPTVKQQTPGSCPICGMTLTPVTKGALRTGVVTVDAVRRQRFGIRTTPAVREAIEKPIRALGKVVLDERRIVDVSVQTHGWVEGLQVRETGQFVKQGTTLAWLYSPVVVAAQDELQLAIKAQRGASAPSTIGATRLDALVRGARGKLRSLGLADWQIDGVANADENPRRFAIVAPTSGYVVTKDVVEGAHIPDGARLFRLVPLDKVWVDADVYARDLPLVEMGQVATARLPGGARQQGTVDWIYPEVAARTQTARIRVELPNDALALRPGMYVDVDILVSMGERLLVPTEAVIVSGRRRLVFVDQGDGALVPRSVVVGVSAGGRTEVTAGLAAGDVVVTSGVFLIAAESRLRSAAGTWGGDIDEDAVDVVESPAPSSSHQGGHHHGQP